MANRIVITQGSYAVSADPNDEISTLLGSCVSCCLWDSAVGVGGMNHMLLSRRRIDDGLCDLSGVNAMELVINDMIKLGAQRHRLVAKVFGGAQMVRGLSDIGNENVSFTLSFLEAEGINCLGKSVGGETARQLLFVPATGVVRQRLVQDSVVEERPVVAPIADAGNDLELL